MANENRIEVICSVEHIRYYKDGWGILTVSIDKVINGTPIQNSYGDIVLKGNMPEIDQSTMYHVVADFVQDPKWGDQYNIIRMYSEVVFDPNDKNGQKKFLSSLYTPRQINLLYSSLEDPYKVLDEGDAASLVQVKGIGMYTAMEMINKYRANIHLGKIFAELGEYDLTNKMVLRLMKRYQSPDIVVQKVKENPYVLADEVDGVGWITADNMARKGGISEYDPRRIAAYIKKYLRDSGEAGQSWVTTDELLGAILDNLGEDTPDMNITIAIQTIVDDLWYNEDKTKIGLKYYYAMEYRLAEELIRLRDAESIIKEENYQDWQETVHRLEEKQGWQFTEEQINGIYLALKENVVLITGMAGTGKSSLVTGILEVLKDYSFVQCALSGRAASRLSEITGEKGYTIHRLLGYPSFDSLSKQGFYHNDERPLIQDVYILDEISMVNTTLFWDLLRAIPSGAKLICLGDHGQLESIGAGNVAHDMISSPEIPTVILSKIHRQAESSGIISEAFNVRQGKQIVEKDFAGQLTKGALKDLHINAYSDASNTYYNVMAAYSTAMAKPDFNIMSTQVLVPIKARGMACTYELNNAIQELVNPADRKKKEVTLFMGSGKPYILREGDKIINTTNNYRLDPVVYNGNIGVVRMIDSVNEEIVADFVGIGEVVIPKEFWMGLELGYAMTVHKCVTGDTLILTNKGVKRIDSLDPGSETESYLPLNCGIEVFNGQKFETPSHFYNAGFGLCKKIITKRGYSLAGTLDHGVDVLDTNGYIVRKNLEDVEVGDFICLNKNSQCYGEETDLPEEWFIFKTDVRSKIYNLPRKMNTDFAQFLGHMVADGVITHSGFRFAKNQKETAEKFKQIVDRLFKTNASFNKLLDGPLGGMYQVEVCSQYIKSFLLHIDGIQPHNKFVPECILSASKECQCAFLRGLFEDGTVRLKKNGTYDFIELASCEKRLLHEVQIMLLNMGMITTYREYKNKNGYDRNMLYLYRRDSLIFEREIGFESYNKQNKLAVAKNNGSISYNRNAIPYINQIVNKLINKYDCEHNLFETKGRHFLGNINNRKTITEERLKQIVQIIKPHIKEKDSLFEYLQFIVDHIYFDPVVITDTLLENTYCLTMPDTHKFVQNGISGWNCQGSEFDHVIIGLDYSAYSLLSRELVYTAITRAKKKCDLIVQTSALRYATATEGVSKKQTHLVDILHELTHPKLVF